MSWQQNATTGDYEMVNGAPVDSERLLEPARFRLRIPRTEAPVPGQPRVGWMYAPDARFGSTLSQIKKRHSTQDPSQIETAMALALEPMVDDGRAADIEVTATVYTRHGAGLETKITDARGDVEKLNLQGLGV